MDRTTSSNISASTPAATQAVPEPPAEAYPSGDLKVGPNLTLDQLIEQLRHLDDAPAASAAPAPAASVPAASVPKRAPKAAQKAPETPKQCRTARPHSRASARRQPVYRQPRESVPPDDIRPRCQHIMPSGRRCRAVRMNAQRFCYFHQNDERRRQLARDMGPRWTLDAAHRVEDRAGLQIAVNEVVRSYVAHAISDRQAGLLLYALNIQVANLRREPGPVIAQKDAEPETEIVVQVAEVAGDEGMPPVARLDPEEEAEYQAEVAAQQAEDPLADPVWREQVESGKRWDEACRRRREEREAAEARQNPAIDFWAGPMPVPPPGELLGREAGAG